MNYLLCSNSVPATTVPAKPGLLNSKYFIRTTKKNLLTLKGVDVNAITELSLNFHGGNVDEKEFICVFPS